MRGAIEELASPHPLGPSLPGMYLDDPFTQQLCAGLDVVLAPVLCALDNMSTYLDLSMTPDDMLPWLGTWVGLMIDPGQRPAKQRELLRSATMRHGWQGTAHGLEMAVQALFGLRVEIVESGAAAWSTSSQDPLPGERIPAVIVRVFPDADSDVDDDRLDAVVAAIKPAHVVHRVQIVWPDEVTEGDAIPELPWEEDDGVSGTDLDGDGPSDS